MTRRDPAAEADQLWREMRDRLGRDFFKGGGMTVQITDEGRVAIHAAGLIFFHVQGRLVATREVGGRLESAIVKEDGSFTFATAAPAGRPQDN